MFIGYNTWLRNAIYTQANTEEGQGQGQGQRDKDKDTDTDTDTDTEAIDWPIFRHYIHADGLIPSSWVIKEDFSFTRPTRLR